MEYKKVALTEEIPTKISDLTPDVPMLPPLPADAATHTYVLKLVNGTLTWVLES